MTRLFDKLAIAFALFIALATPAFAVDLATVATSIVPTATTTIQHGTAGATITAGAVVYIDANGLLQFSKANAAGTAKLVGIALNNASPNQTLSYATAGHVTWNAVLTKGVAVYLSQSGASGNICPVADITSGNFPIIVGIATSTTDLLIAFVNAGVTL